MYTYETFYTLLKVYASVCITSPLTFILVLFFLTGLIPQPRFSRSADGSTKYHYHHHYHDDYDADGMGEMGAVRMNKRLARSYRHEKHPTPVPAASSDANVLSSLTGHHSSRLLSSNKSEAVFSTENSTVIIAQIGSKTYLPCAVRNLGSGVVSGTVNFLFARQLRKTISHVSTQKRMHPTFTLCICCLWEIVRKVRYYHITGFEILSSVILITYREENLI